MTDAAIHGVRLLALLSKQNPGGVLQAALANGPEGLGAAFGAELDVLCQKFSDRGLTRSSVVILLATAAGFAIGDGVNQQFRTSGEAAELMTDTASNVLRYAADRGYMDRAKERQNARG